MVGMTTLYTFPIPSTAVFTPSSLLPVQQSKVLLSGGAMTAGSEKGKCGPCGSTKRSKQIVSGSIHETSVCGLSTRAV